MAEVAVKFLVLESTPMQHPPVEEEIGRYDTYELAEQEITRKIGQMSADLLGPVPSYSIKKVFTAKQ